MISTVGWTALILRGRVTTETNGVCNRLNQTLIFKDKVELKQNGTAAFCKRASCMWVSECVCLLYQFFSFFTLAFVSVNDLSLVSRCILFWKCVRFCFRFCCRLFLFVVSTCILCLLPYHTRCSFMYPTGVSEINHLTWLVYNELRLTGTIFKKSPAKPVLSL